MVIREILFQVTNLEATRGLIQDTAEEGINLIVSLFGDNNGTPELTALYAYRGRRASTAQLYCRIYQDHPGIVFTHEVDSRVLNQTKVVRA